MSLTIKRFSSAPAALTLLALGGCGGDSMNMGMNMPTASTGSTASSSAALEANFDSIQANVFTPICAGCHSGANPASNLALDAMHSYDDLVGVPSTEQPSIMRVVPFDPTNSYLIIHMQREGDGAPASDIPVIAQWISNGAMPGSMTMCMNDMNGMCNMGGMGGMMSADFQVRATLPASGAVVSGPPLRVIVAFTEDLDPSSVNTTSMRLERIGSTEGADAVSAVATVLSIPQGNQRAVMLTPSSALSEGTYRVVLESAIGYDLRSQLGTTLSAPAPGSDGLRIVTRFTVTAPPTE
jgi:hypothetical protein